MSIEAQGHFLTVAQGHLHMKIKTGFSQIPLGHFEPNFVCKLSGTGKMKICQHDDGHMTKMAAMPIYEKLPSKIFFSETGVPISTKLGM